MIFALIGFILGIIIALIFKISIPIEFARYTAVAILAALDSIFGAIKADLKKEYDTSKFLTGLVFNMIIAAGITYLGDRLGLDLYLAVLVAFVIRIFLNIGIIRNYFLDYLKERRKSKY